MGIIDINFENILLDEKQRENILIYDISIKLRIRFAEIDGFIKIYDAIRYLELLSEKSYITDSINNNFAIIRINPYNSLPIEKILTFHDVIMLIKSVVNKNKNNYYYNIFLEKGLYKDKSNTEYF